MASTDPIAVVGLGPTGGVLAALLADYGCEVLVCERERDVIDAPRAVFLDDEVMRVLQRIGCADVLLPFIRPVHGMDLVDRLGRILYRYRPAASVGPLGWADGYMFHQPDLERALHNTVGARPGIRVRTGTTLTGLAQDARGVTLHLRDAQGTHRESRAAFVVGCDGARSTVRRLMPRTSLTVLGPDARWIVADLTVGDGVTVPDVTMQYCDPARPATCVPLPGRKVRVELRVLDGEEGARLCEPESLSALLTPWFAPGTYRVDRVVPYTFHALLAQGWRDGRLLIAGDAAHQMPPFLGQGMGCGVRDAADLAWKLAAVWRGTAEESLLDTFEAERSPATHHVIATDLRLGDLIQTTDPVLAARRDADALASGGAVSLTPPRVGIGQALCSTHSVAGLPFPQWRMSSGEWTDALLGPGFAVIGACAPSQRVSNVLASVGVRWVHDPPTPISAWLDAQGVLGVIVRPDRIVLAAVHSSAELDTAIEALATHLVDRHGVAA